MVSPTSAKSRGTWGREAAATGSPARISCSWFESRYPSINPCGSAETRGLRVSHTLLTFRSATLGATNASQTSFRRQRPRLALPATGCYGRAGNIASHLYVPTYDDAQIMTGQQVAELLQNLAAHARRVAADAHRAAVAADGASRNKITNRLLAVLVGEWLRPLRSHPRRSPPGRRETEPPAPANPQPRDPS